VHRQVKHSPRPELELSSIEDGVILAPRMQEGKTLKNEKTDVAGKKCGVKAEKSEKTLDIPKGMLYNVKAV